MDTLFNQTKQMSLELIQLVSILILMDTLL